MDDRREPPLLASHPERGPHGRYDPQDWQKALVVEIHKGKGSLTDPNNYRPVSLLSSRYKLMAHIIKP